MLTKRTKDDLLMFGLFIFAVVVSVLIMIYSIHEKFYNGVLSAGGVLFLAFAAFLDFLKTYFFEGVPEVSEKEKHEESKERGKEIEKSNVA